MAGYAAAKARIFARQAAGDLAVLGMDDAGSPRDARRAAGRRWCRSPATGRQPGGIWAEGRCCATPTGPSCRPARGPRPARQPQCPERRRRRRLRRSTRPVARDVARGLRSYPGLPHRQERVGEIGGVAFVNDSKATNADSRRPRAG